MLTPFRDRKDPMATLRWLGHASFRLDTDGGKRVYVDPFPGGPTYPDDEKDPERADVVFVTHGHGDHASGAADFHAKTGCKVLCMVELGGWFTKNGVAEDAVTAFNKGGTVDVDGVRFTLVNAFHSGSAPDGSYGGEPAGVVVRFDGKSVYFAGDTCVFGDMQLIARLYEPDVAVLPIGDFYTMGPEEAALALELLGNPRCVPCHWGTFPLLTGTPDELAKLTSAHVERIEPGDSVTI
jgi:L-ascorbate metabolism protein UlaG (beta-lactamase superfamily)